ncbi:MAG: 5'-3' exonuclease H3TH domain-containing protein, partial [Dehalococcoidia bacterium]
MSPKAKAATKAKPKAGSKSKTSDETPRLVIFDGHGIIYRAYFAMPQPLTVRKTGEVVTAVFGFANTLLTVLEQLKPTHIAVALDPPGKTFRHEKDESYKAQRVKAPDDLIAQLGRVRELIEAFNIPIYMSDGYEADDVLGTLAKQAEKQGLETYLVTLDSDIIQLIGNGTRVFMMRPYQRDTVIYDEAGARERYGIEPKQMPDLKGLKGDTSDNVPGVPGVGEKTAMKLIEQFGTIDNIYQHLDDVTPEKLREKLREHEADARHSREMTVISTDAPVKLDLDACAVGRFDREQVIELFRELEFRSLVDRLPDSGEPEGDGRRPAEAKAIEGQEYRAVYSEAELDELAKQLKKAKSFAFAVETTEPNAMRALPVGLSFSWAAGQAAYVPIGHRPGLGDPEQPSLELVLS